MNSINFLQIDIYTVLFAFLFFIPIQFYALWQGKEKRLRAVKIISVCPHATTLIPLDGFF
jgi:hypothetical protein